MKPRHAVALVLRPLLITLGILGIAYLLGGPELFTPSGFVGFVLITVVVGIAILCGLGAIHNEYRHVNATASLLRRSTPRHRSIDIPKARDPTDRKLRGNYMDTSVPGYYGMRADTPEKVMRFTRRVFRSRP